VSKSRQTAVRRTNKRIDRHEDRCQRDHTRLRNEVISAFLIALEVRFPSEPGYKEQFRRVMVERLDHRPRRQG
jgi:hypothetical protein